MSSASEICVDELLKRLTELDALLCRLDNESSQQDGLINESRELLTSTQSFIDNNNALIPGYCLKKAVDSINKLENYVKKSQESKINFKFKQVKSRVRVDLDKPASELKHEVTTPPVYEPAQTNTIGFSEKTNESLALGPAEVEFKDVSLSRLASCNIVIKGLANTVYISDLTNTSVVISIACRAITIKKCANCKFKLVCQQLRIDSTVDCEFEIFTTARSMLESSNGLKFRRLCPDSEMADFMLKSNMDINSNNWKYIDDFDWLSPNVPSQHYKLVDDN